jgi:hypothetical protein
MRKTEVRICDLKGAVSNRPRLTTRRWSRPLSVAAVAAYVAWLSGTEPQLPPRAAGPLPVGPVAVTPAQLAAAPGPAYWAGPVAGTRLELTRTASGRTFLRYLPAGEPIGSPRAHLTVATYPQRGAHRRLAAEAARGSSLSRALGGRRLALTARRDATSAFLATAGEDHQVEVFHPVPGRAWSLAAAGRIRPAP